MGFDSENTNYKRFLSLQKIEVKLTALEGPLKGLRAIKEPCERELLREAARLGCRGYDFVITLLKEGVTEIEIAKALEIFWLKEGAQGLAFAPIIAFGGNSSHPHYRAGQARLEKGHNVLIDIGVSLNHYHSDMTRVVFFGNPDKSIKKIYEIVKKAQQAALEACKEGVTVGELDNIARKVIANDGYGDYFTHSLGHGIGLDVHEFPTLRHHPSLPSTLLQEGMAITLEPGIYLPGLGGVRIEDTVLITPQGCENLSSSSKEMIIF